MGLGAAAVPAIEAAGSIATSATSGLFGLNQARKNRQFQERMYYQQLEDNRENWRMANEYALPSAELQRIRDAGLNPYLYYKNGGQPSQVATGASAPHGSQAQANFQNPFAGFTANMQAMKMMQAQIDNINADTQQKQATTENVSEQALQNRLMRDINIAIRYRDYDFLNQQIADLNSQIWSRENLTTQQVISLAQDREYQIKRFHMDKNYQGEMIAQGWENIAIGHINASASLKQAAAAMMQARNAARLVPYQLALFAQQYAFNAENNKLLLGQNAFEVLAKQAGWKTEQARTFEREFKNQMLKHFGSDETGSWYKNLAPFAEQMKLGFSNILDSRWWLSPLGTYHK